MIISVLYILIFIVVSNLKVLIMSIFVWDCRRNQHIIWIIIHIRNTYHFIFTTSYFCSLTFLLLNILISFTKYIFVFQWLSYWYLILNVCLLFLKLKFMIIHLPCLYRRLFKKVLLIFVSLFIFYFTENCWHIFVHF